MHQFRHQVDERLRRRQRPVVRAPGDAGSVAAGAGCRRRATGAAPAGHRADHDRTAASAGAGRRVERRPDPHNRRADRWYLLPAGLERLNAARGAGAPVMTQMLSRLSSAGSVRAARLSRALRRGPGRPMRAARSPGAAAAVAGSGTTPHERRPSVGLFIYPVKSAAGIACERVQLEAAGPAARSRMDDRRCRRALHHAARRGSPGAAATAIAGGRLQPVAFPQARASALPLDHEGRACAVQVWSSQLPRLRCRYAKPRSSAPTCWAGPLRLVRFDLSQPRLSDPRLDRRSRGAHAVSPMAIRCWCCRRHPSTILPRAWGGRFPCSASAPMCCSRASRPMRKTQASVLEAGDVRLQLTKACTRCVITTIDPATGERTGEEPLATLKRYRFDRGAARRGLRAQCLCTGRRGRNALRAVRRASIIAA